MYYYWRAMINKGWQGGDRYYHCLASCKTARIAGPDISFNLGLMREIEDEAHGWVKECRGDDNKGKGRKFFDIADIRDNLHGIIAPLTETCESRCKPLADPRMPLP